MDTKKLKEEIKLLERKLELMEQINRLQAIPVYPVYPPIYWPDRYPKSPWWEYHPWTSTGATIPCVTTSGTITAYNEPVTSNTAFGQCDQVSYTDCTSPILKDSDQITIRGMSWGKSPQYSHHKVMVK